MKRVAKPVFFIVLAVILAFTGIVFFGVHTQYGDFTTTIITVSYTHLDVYKRQVHRVVDIVDRHHKPVVYHILRHLKS